MSYEHVDATSVEPTPDRPSLQRSLDDALDLASVAFKRYEAEPGEQLPFVYHYHDEQEEVFYVLSGTLHVETPEKVYEIGADEVFAVDPGDPQRAFVPEDADAGAVVLAVGAPPVADDAHQYEPEG